jgi:hypothetical protein
MVVKKGNQVDFTTGFLLGHIQFKIGFSRDAEVSDLIIKLEVRVDVTAEA